MMTSVLRSLDGKDLLERHPNLVAYKARCQARPAFAAALAAQLPISSNARRFPPEGPKLEERDDDVCRRIRGRRAASKQAAYLDHVW